jgi:hypothetical protein
VIPRRTGEARGPHLGEDELLDLVHGEPDTESRQRGLAHVKGCTACSASLKERIAEQERARVTFHRAVRGSAHHSSDGAESAAGKQIPRPAPSAGGTPREAAMRRAILAAAATLLVIASIVLWRSTARDPLATLAAARSGSLPPHPEFLTLRHGSEAGASVVTRSGIEAYARGDLKRAVDLLERVPSNDPAFPLARLYVASALVRRGQFEHAASRLAELHEDDLPEPWSDEHAWLSAVSSLGAGDTARADSMLHEIETGPTATATRARALRREWRAVQR